MKIDDRLEFGKKGSGRGRLVLRRWGAVLVLVVVLMLVAAQSAVPAQVDWTTLPRDDNFDGIADGIGWNNAPTDRCGNGGFYQPGPSIQRFVDVAGTGINMAVSYSGNAFEYDSQPTIYDCEAPVPPLAGSLRVLDNNTDTGGVPGSATGPTIYEIEFTPPVLLNQFVIGGLSHIPFYSGGVPDRYEWVQVQAYDEQENPIVPDGIGGSTYQVDSAGNYLGVTTIPGAPFISGNMVRGTSSQRFPPLNLCYTEPGTVCGYDNASFSWLTTPVKRITVIFFITRGPDAEDPRTIYGSIALHTVDFSPGLELGDLVWEDIDDNGIYEPNEGEVGINGVTVHLHPWGDDPRTAPPMAVTVTGAGDLPQGRYRFSGLGAGDYLVYIPPENFQEGGQLAGYVSSTVTEWNPNDDENEDGSGGPGTGSAGYPGSVSGPGDENGRDRIDPARKGIASGMLTLALGTEPVQEDAAGIQTVDDVDSNLTLDFGFTTDPTPVTLTSFTAMGRGQAALFNWLKAGDLDRRVPDLLRLVWKHTVAAWFAW
jgi:hypothetical protein